MNDSTRAELQALVDRTLNSVHAGHALKRRMSEELLTHVTAAFEEESAAGADDAAALQRTRERFGDPAQLAGQFHKSVPWLERTIFSWFPEKERSVKRYFWIVLGLSALVCWDIAFPDHTGFIAGSVVTLLALGMIHWCQTDVAPARWLRRRWALPVGFFAFSFGPAIILPALARYKLSGATDLQVIMPLIIGTLITVAGLALLMYGLVKLRSHRPPHMEA